MNDYYADLHIHIGRTLEDKPVKISASKDLTFFNIAHEASERKGMEIIGIIDCHAPSVQRDIMTYLDNGEMSEIAGGGIRYKQTTVLLGCEIEVRDAGLGPAHLLAYFPDLSTMRNFSLWMKDHMKNTNLSSQRIYVPARELQAEVVGRGGIMIPAHIFTPHKSMYGSCTDRLAHVLNPAQIAAVELGLSSDTTMASQLSELDAFSFLTNSDAHSLAKIGREYNQLRLAAANFEEFCKALARTEGREITANYGLNPRLGKYYRTFCKQCDKVIDDQLNAYEHCVHCGSRRIVRGVLDRIMQIADRPESADVVDQAIHCQNDRPPYIYQVPLEYIPGLGKRKLNELLQRFGTEMNILHHTTRGELAEAAGEDVADYILRARNGTLELQVGGGGHYGKVTRK